MKYPIVRILAVLTIVAVGAVAVVAMESRQRVDESAHEVLGELSELGPELGTPADVFSIAFSEPPTVGQGTISQIGGDAVTVTREVSSAFAQRCVTAMFEAASPLDELEFADGNVERGRC